MVRQGRGGTIAMCTVVAGWVGIAAIAAAADDCADLAASIQRLETGGDARDGQLVRQLHVVHYKTCVLDPTTPAPRQSWYTSEGRRLATAADGARPPSAAYMTSDDTARLCAGKPAPSICALLIDAEKGRVARAARMAAPVPPALPGGGLSALSSPACTARLKLLAASAKAGAQGVMGPTYSALARDCADVLQAVAREARTALPTRALGSRSRRAFGDALDGRPTEGPSGPSDVDSEWDLAQVLQFGLNIATLATQLQSIKAVSAVVPGKGARLAPEGCRQLRDNAEICRKRQANMGSVGQSGSGTTGQAGAFNDCANTYEAAYRAACR